MDDFGGAVADDDVADGQAVAGVVGGDCLGQHQAVGVGICRQVDGGDGGGNAFRRTQRADAGGEIEAVLQAQAQGPQLGLLDAAVDGSGGWVGVGWTNTHWH